MTIGDGDIASVLPDSKLVFFASGVSNSKEDRRIEFDREMNLLMQQDKTHHIVYFSTLAVFYGHTHYVQHKKRMEALVKEFPHYTILRLGNITWGKNPHTLINYLKDHPTAEIKDTYRYIVDKDEFLHWIDLIPDWNCELNITGKRMKVREIYEQYARLRSE